MDITDRKLLNLIQSPFPMVDQPFQKLGEEVGISEQEVLDRLTELKRTNVLRQISAIFDTRRLGFKTTLVAMAYEPKQLHKAAMEINKHPGVSHNYAREGSYYNLWFTLAVPPEHDLEATAAYMSLKTGAIEQRIMPTKRFFKIGVNFDMVKKKGSSFNFSPDNVKSSEDKAASDKEAAESWNKAVPITEAEKDAIRGMQEDLELIPRPYDSIAQQLGMSTDEL
ncbi:MAG TPA: Lrp/AsnC family transcriptional regulator, partial [Dehalococcoidia bacterium]|nr:Lrp/AsnC family transcriptional regulator [Dehalococcoidia bacterium]